MRARMMILAVGVLLSALAAGCGSSSSSDSSSSSSSTPAASSTASASSSSSTSSAVDTSKPGERYSTVLDALYAKTKIGLPTVSIDTGGGMKAAFKQGEKMKIAFFGYGSGFTYSPPEFAGAKDVPKQLGLDMTTFDPAGDPQKQVSQIQAAAASGKYNTFVVYPLETDLECALLTKQLPAKGFLVAAVGQPACTDATSSPGLLTVVDETGSPEVYGAWADKIVKDNPGKQEVLMLTGPATDWLSQQAAIALKKAAAANPDFHIEEVIRTDYTPAGALKKGQDALQQYPNTTIVADAFPEGTQGMLTAVKTAGKTGKLKIYDFGTSAFGIKQIMEGNVTMSVPFYPYTKVKTALEALAIARSGGKVPRYITYSGHAPEPIRGAGDPVLFVTKDNVAKFKSLIAEF
jgi:ribose transport system substrate-binding protein